MLKYGCIELQLPFCEEKSVQLVRVAFFRSDFLQNPYCRAAQKYCEKTFLSVFETRAESF